MKRRNQRNSRLYIILMLLCQNSIFSKIIDCDAAKKASCKLKEEFEEEHKRIGKYPPCHYCKKPVILRKIVGTKISDFFIMIIVIKIVILRVIVVPRKTTQTNSLHNEQMVQKITRKIQIFVCRYSR